ncbi:ATP-grasp domain-containing protein [Rhizobium sp. MC63]|uniref:ATP-grasp domain-containing protein n=1 Tax=Rhizobium mulingense TaxID=3031128 RepID=A0ACC6MYK7_9HYPH|nr:MULTISPECIES: ATP-grasp domain-containing protein [unclassified Rhizobium]MDF0697581.1 ATP-grasp domain-containing protein [Rhizobium sp. MC63]MEA3518429.1 ATP-grasp domain-containing protein [Rhizobium sp. MJ31]
MQWILQEFEDTHKLAEALDRLGIPYSWHKVVPFIGELIPEPVVADPSAVVMFGSYTLWRNAAANGYRPGMFKLRPFVEEKVWHPYLLNGADALFLTLREVPACLADDGREWFLRPVDDGKEEPGNVKSAGEIIRMVERVLALDEDEIPAGSLRHDTLLMFTKPVRILREWRLWAVNDRIVTYSLYKEGSRVIHRHEIDDDALEFGRRMVDLNPGYSPAYVIDVCRTEGGLRLLETNCLNAAGFYAADLTKLAAAIDGLAYD